MWCEWCIWSKGPRAFDCLSPSVVYVQPECERKVLRLLHWEDVHKVASKSREPLPCQPVCTLVRILESIGNRGAPQWSHTRPHDGDSAVVIYISASRQAQTNSFASKHSFITYVMTTVVSQKKSSQTSTQNENMQDKNAE
jgi:hypothetical protein